MKKREEREQASRAMLKVRQTSEGSKAILLKKIGREIQSLVGKQCLDFADLVNVFGTLVMPSKGKEIIEDAARGVWTLVAGRERIGDEIIERVSIEGVTLMLVHSNLYPSHDLNEQNMQLKREKKERMAKECRRKGQEACWKAGKETEILVKRRIERFVQKLMNVLYKADDRLQTEENFATFLNLLGNEGLLKDLNIASQNPPISGKDKRAISKGYITSLENSLGETSTSPWRTKAIKEQYSEGLKGTERTWEKNWDFEDSRNSTEGEPDIIELSEGDGSLDVGKIPETLEIGKVADVLISGIERIYFKPSKWNPNEQPESSPIEKWVSNFFRPLPAWVQEQNAEECDEIPSPQSVSTVHMFSPLSPIKTPQSTPKIANKTDDTWVQLCMSRLYEALAVLMDNKAAKSRVFESFNKASSACPQPKQKKIKRPLYKSKKEKPGK